jgi:hypothetical protein
LIAAPRDETPICGQTQKKFHRPQCLDQLGLIQIRNPTVMIPILGVPKSGNPLQVIAMMMTRRQFVIGTRSEQIQYQTASNRIQKAKKITKS